jgi:Fe-S cluster biogenesis protein NfuA
LDIEAVAAAAAELRELVSGDGADLRLVRVDARSGQVEFELDLSATGCADCVLPPPAVLSMVNTVLKRSRPGDYEVIVDDPRTGARTAAAPSGAHMTIVDPAAETGGGDDDPGPDAGALRGRTVGFRVDVLWRSWDWVVDEWAASLGRAGAKTLLWRRNQGLDGEAGRRHHEDFAAFLRSVDVAVVGLGNCGSCTSWTIKDAVAALDSGLPTVGVTTAQFERLGHTLAGHYGRPGLRLHVLPYPLDTRPEAEVRQIAGELYAPMLGLLGAVI